MYIRQRRMIWRGHRFKEESERGTKRITKLWGNCLLDHESSVEVGYGFHAIRSKLLIANDMC